MLLYTFPADDCRSLVNSISNELVRITEWMKINKLEINVNKIKCKVLGNERQYEEFKNVYFLENDNYKIEAESIEVV